MLTRRDIELLASAGVDWAVVEVRKTGNPNHDDRGRFSGGDHTHEGYASASKEEIVGHLVSQHGESRAQSEGQSHAAVGRRHMDRHEGESAVDLPSRFPKDTRTETRQRIADEREKAPNFQQSPASAAARRPTYRQYQERAKASEVEEHMKKEHDYKDPAKSAAEESQERGEPYSVHSLHASDHRQTYFADGHSHLNSGPRDGHPA